MDARYQKEREREVERAIAELRRSEPELAEEIEGLPWIEDGISRNEFNAVRGLIRLAHEGYAAQLLEEPWVEEGKNLPALESLWFLNGSNQEALSQVMSHPTINDGISEQEAKIVAALHPFLNPTSWRNSWILNWSYWRSVRSPCLWEGIRTSIVRMRPGADHTMDSLERAVRSIEEFIGLPFPRRHAVYLFEEGGSGGSAARNLGIRVVLLVNEQALTEEQILGLLTMKRVTTIGVGVRTGYMKGPLRSWNPLSGIR